MNALRTLCVVIVCLAVIASAAGDYPTCPGSSDSYGNISCVAAGSCAGALCNCRGGTAGSGLTCSGASTTQTCDQTKACAVAFFMCLNNIAATLTSSSDCSSTLSSLHASFVLLQSGGEMWNQSDAFVSCNKAACMLYNSSTTGTCTTQNNYASVCKMSPVVYTGQLVLTGDFTAIMGNTTAKAELEACLRMDMTNHFRFMTNVDQTTLGANGTLIVIFTVQADEQLIANELASAATGTSWMTCLSAAKFAELGGTGTLGVGSIGGTTPPSSTSGGTTPATTAPATTSASMIWSAAQVLVAIVAMLVLA